MSEKPSPVAPYLLAMVVCDNVHLDPGTGKRTLLGTYSAIMAPGFPALHPMMAVYIAVTGCVGPNRFTLKLVDVNDTATLFEAHLDMPEADRRAVVELHGIIQNVVFPSPGEYRLQLYAQGEFIVERRILVMNPPTTPGEPNEPPE